MKKVIVIGGGVSGLICYYILKQYTNNILLFDHNEKLGGEFLNNGIQYVKGSGTMKKFLTGLGILFSSYMVRGGMLIGGKIKKFPQCLDGLRNDQLEKVRFDYYRKTHLVHPEEGMLKLAFNDPFVLKQRTALAFDFSELVEKLSIGVNHVKKRVKYVGEDFVLADSCFEKFDYLVYSIPLWEIKQISLVGEYPDSVVSKKVVVETECDLQRDKFSGWTYVLTPYTMFNAVSRIKHTDFGYMAECYGNKTEMEIKKDLYFLFQDGFQVRKVSEMKGEMLPISKNSKISYEKNIALMGKYSNWDNSITLDDSLSRVKKISARWF